MTDIPGAPAAPSLQFIGTATTLLRLGGFTVLTDPNFLHRGQLAYLGRGLVSRRLTEPALTIAEPPPLDAVVLSHLHGDHWDRVARRGLDHEVPVLTTPHASRRLQLQGFARAVGLRTWADHTLVRGGRTLRVTALPGEHAHGALRALLPPVMGTMLELGAPDGTVDFRLYISGDTLLTPSLDEIPTRYPDLDAAVLHLGGTTLPGGAVVTLGARDGLQLLRLVDARIGVPVHHDDYGLFKSPLADFRTEVAAAGLGARVRLVERGETIPLT